MVDLIATGHRDKRAWPRMISRSSGTSTPTRATRGPAVTATSSATATTRNHPPRRSTRGPRWRFLGEFTGNKRMRDLGVYLYVTEIASVLNYWFDIHGIVFDPRSIRSRSRAWCSGAATGTAPGGLRSRGRSMGSTCSRSPPPRCIWRRSRPSGRCRISTFMKARRAEYETASPDRRHPERHLGERVRLVDGAE